MWKYWKGKFSQLTDWIRKKHGNNEEHLSKGRDSLLASKSIHRHNTHRFLASKRCFDTVSSEPKVHSKCLGIQMSFDKIMASLSLT